jgi:RHS repeat-associated protein
LPYGLYDTSSWDINVTLSQNASFQYELILNVSDGTNNYIVKWMLDIYELKPPCPVPGQGFFWSLTDNTVPNCDEPTMDMENPDLPPSPLNRVNMITANSYFPVAGYAYIGENTVVRVDRPMQHFMLDLWGGNSGTFDGLDRFNRIIDQRWVSYASGMTDLDRYKYGYDRNSNRQWKENDTATNLDEYYTYDNLNRLSDMKRGQLTGSPPSGISGTPAKEQAWTLDKTGNWSGFVTKTTGTTDLNQTRTSNVVNEITAISESVGTSWADPTYDAAGNTITMPQPANLGSSYTAVYDAWNRMVKLSDASNTVAEYEYDGRGRRIVKLTYTSGTLSETRHFYWSNDWQDLEERVDSSSSADVEYVYGTRYVDELLWRHKSGSGDLFALQDANFNVTAIWSPGGVAERYVFYPYGQRLIYDASWSSIGSSSYDWQIGRQGLMLDPESGLIYNRWRYLHALLGRFGQRDRKKPRRGESLYWYVDDRPTSLLDPDGESPLANPIVIAVVAATYGCLSHWVLAMQARTDWSNDKYAHCVVSCQIAKACGAGISQLAGYGKEAIDELRRLLLADGIGWDPADLISNSDGRDCATSDLWVVFGPVVRWCIAALQQSCDDCCLTKHAK